jgi:hypothetical protein
MTRNRVIFLVALALLPIAFLAAAGLYHLWKVDALIYAWWPMLACFALAYVLAWRWQRGTLRQVADEPPAEHYTDRDRLAWKLIEARIRETEKLDVEKLAGMEVYTEVAQKLAPELAAIYHPEASDPVGNLTLPEVLAVVELAAHDLGQLARTHLPGGHIATLDHFRRARKAVDIYQKVRNTYWAAAAVIDPIQTGLRYLASQAGLGKPMTLFKENVFLWFFAQYVRRLGHYMIELYSGRLRVDVARYRELQREMEQTRAVGPDDVLVADPSSGARAVTIATIGQVKAGKSSLINAILGERRARTDVIPATSGISRYEVVSGDAKLALLDTVGYNLGGPDGDQFESTVDAAQQADLILLVTHARNPGRDADVKLWNDLKAWFADRPELKMPAVLLVVTHIDLLSPAMEWLPPYDWRNPSRLKEKNIAEAVGVAKEQFGAGIVSVVPVRAAEKRVYGVTEELIPELTTLLGQARAVAFLRCLHAEADERQMEKILDQVLTAGKALLGHWLK